MQTFSEQELSSIGSQDGGLFRSHRIVPGGASHEYGANSSIGGPSVHQILLGDHTTFSQQNEDHTALEIFKTQSFNQSSSCFERGGGPASANNQPNDNSKLHMQALELNALLQIEEE